MLWFSVGAGSEALGAANGWSEPLYKAWYLTGAVFTAGWLGLGTAFLLGKTRFGYAFAFALFLAGLFTFLTQRSQQYPNAGSTPSTMPSRALSRVRTRPARRAAPRSRLSARSWSPGRRPASRAAATPIERSFPAAAHPPASMPVSAPGDLVGLDRIRAAAILLEGWLARAQ